VELPEMNKALNVYYSITASFEFREVERFREKAQHDEAQALHHAKQEGRAEGGTDRSIEIARKMLEIGEPIDKITLLADLTQQEIELYQK